ncbi:hypothetical protein O3M35_001460 [Rhynocoris fuscipes]|uniref:Uncharacterized protein n=1 Tax=Rhynocoris fuscipes TaxID=488301 RepID=A0AAW1CRG3_9HEMI
MTSSENTCFRSAYPRTRDAPCVVALRVVIGRRAQDELCYIGLQERVWPKLPPRQRRKKNKTKNVVFSYYSKYLSTCKSNHEKF